MQSKISVLLLKGKNVDEMSDMNKMAVHLEQVLTEKDGVELKTRQGLTDPAIKSADFIVFCGYDCGTLGEIFKTLGVVEGLEGNDGPIIFMYEEPGNSVYEYIDRILTAGMDLGRVDPKLFNKVIDTNTYRDIIGYIDVALRKLGTSTTS
jgi:hypothetical protein